MYTSSNWGSEPLAFQTSVDSEEAGRQRQLDRQLAVSMWQESNSDEYDPHGSAWRRERAARQQWRAECHELHEEIRLRTETRREALEAGGPLDEMDRLRAHHNLE